MSPGHSLSGESSSPKRTKPTGSGSIRDYRTRAQFDIPEAERSKETNNIEAEVFASDDTTMIPSDEELIRVAGFRVNRQGDPLGPDSDSESETLVRPKKRRAVYARDVDIFREDHPPSAVLPI